MVLNLTIRRRGNVQILFQAFVEIELALGAAPKGLEQSFAAKLHISPSMWSQIKAERPITDKLARQIETLSGKPSGWLDQAQSADLLDEQEKSYLKLALKVYRASNNKQRRELEQQLKLRS